MSRWLLKAPAAASDDWVMEFRASRDIEPGEELLNSYGERRCGPQRMVFKRFNAAANPASRLWSWVRPSILWRTLIRNSPLISHRLYILENVQKDLLRCLPRMVSC